MTNTPGIYVKGDVEREAFSAREAVALVWDGFVLKTEPEAAEAPAEEPVAKDPEPTDVLEALTRPTPLAIPAKQKD